MARRQNPKIERTLKRTSSLRLVKQTFLIVCEGEVTEPEYFNSFRLTSANVKDAQIDAAHKAAVHETQFPKDLENAYELGRELVRQAQEE